MDCNRAGFQATEKAVSQIQTLGFQKQMQAMNSARTSDQIFREMERDRNPNDSGNGGGRTDRNSDAFLNRQKAAADFDVTFKSNEILQLNAEMQNALRRRVDAYKEMLQLESDYMEWKSVGNQKQDKLSEYLDLDGSRSAAHNKAMLELVEKRGTKVAQGTTKIKPVAAALWNKMPRRILPGSELRSTLFPSG